MSADPQRLRDYEALLLPSWRSDYVAPRQWVEFQKLTVKTPRAPVHRVPATLLSVYGLVYLIVSGALWLTHHQSDARDVLSVGAFAMYMTVMTPFYPGKYAFLRGLTLAGAVGFLGFFIVTPLIKHEAGLSPYAIGLLAYGIFLNVLTLVGPFRTVFASASEPPKHA